ncbi:unnamed protein product [Tilletia laevis]|uniref:GATA-type domain-containing protein n=2 Tax=Tilletia TaxID=13289 RepID=A0A177UQ53_9BASI|nr:hypothetical protein CF336_g1576 [Tilletia laevis]KAE8263281.1 hypothetical protein A4X03_0g1800 [Tilletia caries]KAE8206437.1 hypothetical protein CF335_g1889 [Tilletia laevis]CAD6891503.1 unnamed protein product [Tilletia caries]CAD6906383.1 unnamed protein product [Tilletia caries]
MSAPSTPSGRRDRPNWASASTLLNRSLDAARAAVVAEANLNEAQAALAESENALAERQRALNLAEQEALQAEQAAAEAMRRAAERRALAREREAEVWEEEDAKADAIADVEEKRAEYERWEAEVRQTLGAAEVVVGVGPSTTSAQGHENGDEPQPNPHQDGSSSERGDRSNGASSFFSALANRLSGHISGHQGSVEERSTGGRRVLQPLPILRPSSGGPARQDSGEMRRASSLAPGLTSLVRRSSSGPTPASSSSVGQLSASIRGPLRPLGWRSSTVSATALAGRVVQNTTSTTVGAAPETTSSASGPAVPAPSSARTFASSVEVEMAQIRPSPVIQDLQPTTRSNSYPIDSSRTQQADFSVDIPILRNTPQQERGAEKNKTTGAQDERGEDGQPPTKKAKTQDFAGRGGDSAQAGARSTSGPSSSRFHVRLNSSSPDPATTTSPAPGTGAAASRFHMRLRSSSPDAGATSTPQPTGSVRGGGAGSSKVAAAAASHHSRDLRPSELHHGASHARTCSSCGTHTTSTWRRTPVMAAAGRLVGATENAEDGEDGSVGAGEGGGDGHRPWLCQACYMRAWRALLVAQTHQDQDQGQGHDQAQAQAGPSAASQSDTIQQQGTDEETPSKAGKSSGHTHVRAQETTKEGKHKAQKDKEREGDGGAGGGGSTSAERDENEDWNWAINRDELEMSSEEEDDDDDDDDGDGDD